MTPTPLSYLCRSNNKVYRCEAIGSRVTLVAATEEEAEEQAQQLVDWIVSRDRDWYVRYRFDDQKWELCYVKHVPVEAQPIDLEDLQRLENK